MWFVRECYGEFWILDGVEVADNERELTVSQCIVWPSTVYYITDDWTRGTDADCRHTTFLVSHSAIY